MSEKSLPLGYVNSLVYELLKSFWDERGKGARFRLTTVGREYFRERCLPQVESQDLDAIVGTLGGILSHDGIATQVGCSRENRLLHVRVEGCVHRQVEDRMAAQGIEPLACLPANLMALAIEEKLDRPVELAEVGLGEAVCELLLIVFDSRPTLA